MTSNSMVVAWSIAQQQFTVLVQITTHKLDGGGGAFKVSTLEPTAIYSNVKTSCVLMYQLLIKCPN